MTSIRALLNSEGNVIMLYVTPEQIARERDALSKWWDTRWAEIHHQDKLVKSILADDAMVAKFGRRAGAVLVKHVRASREKEDPAALLAAMSTADRIRAEHGGDAAWATISTMDAIGKLLGDYTTRSAEISRAERRSEYWRWAVQAPSPPRQGHH
jgi:hypothetical protein